eukprot:scaffold69159_cov118-Phaeocystis_antarctica.AAC.3
MTEIHHVCALDLSDLADDRRDDRALERWPYGERDDLFRGDAADRANQTGGFLPYPICAAPQVGCDLEQHDTRARRYLGPGAVRVVPGGHCVLRIEVNAHMEPRHTGTPQLQVYEVLEESSPGIFDGAGTAGSATAASGTHRGGCGRRNPADAACILPNARRLQNADAWLHVLRAIRSDVQCLKSGGLTGNQELRRYATRCVCGLPRVLPRARVPCGASSAIGSVPASAVVHMHSRGRFPGKAKVSRAENEVAGLGQLHQYAGHGYGCVVCSRRGGHRD